MNQSFVAFYDQLDDPIVSYYIEKIKCLVANQRFQNIMNQLITGAKKTGYRYGIPTTPFGFLLQEMRVKLKPRDRKSVLRDNIKIARSESISEQSIRELIERFSSRFDRVTPAMLQDLDDDNYDLEDRLAARSSQLMIKSIRSQFGDIDESLIILSPKHRQSLLLHTNS